MSVEVALKGVPVDLWQRASAHQDAIKREFDILMADLGQDSVPHLLAEMMSGLDVQFAGVGDSTWAQLYEAAERGQPEVDLVFRVPPEVAPAAAELDRMLDQVDDFCRSGDRLLTLATPPELASFRRWLLGEFTRQIEQGLPPISWTQYEEPANQVTDGSSTISDAPANTRIDFEGELDLATAGALRDSIISARVTEGGTLLLDLSRVTFIDSVGLSLLVTAHNRFSDDGGHMQIIFPDRLRRFIEMTGLLDVLDVEFVDQDSGRDSSGEGS